MRYQREMEALLETAERRLETVEAYHPGGITVLIEDDHLISDG